MQGPDTKHVIYFPAILGQGEHVDEQSTSNTTNDQRPHWVHQVRTGTDGDQTGQGSVMNETRVILAENQRGQGTADHGHQ